MCPDSWSRPERDEFVSLSACEILKITLKRVNLTELFNKEEEKEVSSCLDFTYSH